MRAAHVVRVPPHPPVRFDGGAPDVGGLAHDSILADDGSPYMRRYWLARSSLATVRFHHLLASDAGRDLHDHPWDFVSLLLTGAYREVTPDGVCVFEAPCVVSRQAESLHRLELLDGPMWTYVVTGSVRRKWGFATGDGWMPWDAVAGVDRGY